MMRNVTAVCAFVGGLSVAFAEPVSAQPSGPPPISNADLETKAREACRGEVSLSSSAISTADMDGDGRTDVLFNWAQVTCSSGGVASQGAGFCGMHNCSIDVYLSSQYRPGGWPKPIMNHREIAPDILPAGAYPILRTAYQGGSCAFSEICERAWRWNGSKFISQEIAAADRRPVSPPTPHAAQAALPVTEANVAGVWVDDGDGCATDAVISFKADGSYAAYERNGDWRLLGDRIAVMVRETYILGDEGSRRQIRDPKPTVLTVTALSSARMSVRHSSGQISTLRRCG